MNPFSSRFIRPGAREYLFPPNDSLDCVLQRLREKRIVQLVGPHGSGKSTLVEMICRAIDCDFVKMVIRSHEDKNDSLKKINSAIGACSANHLIILDGIEQLKASQQNRILAQCQKRNLMLLVTTHESVGIETLLQTESSYMVFKQIVDEMLASESSNVALVDEAEMAKAFQNNGPNIREALFELYDVFERRSFK